VFRNSVAIGRHLQRFLALEQVFWADVQNIFAWLFVVSFTLGQSQWRGCADNPDAFAHTVEPSCLLVEYLRDDQKVAWGHRSTADAKQKFMR